MSTTVDAEEIPPVRDFSRTADRTTPVRAAKRPLRQRLRMPLLLAGPLVVAIGASWWYLTSGRYVSTDDAYVQAARVQISNEISGRVVAIEVRDNQRVTKGDVLFRIDPRPFEIAVENAKAQLAAATLQVNALKATYNQKAAEAKAAEDTASYQQREYDRQRQLVASGVAARSTFDQMQNTLQMARQKVISTQADLANTLAQLGGNADIPIEQHPSVQRAKADLDKADLNLSYTVVRAPEEGIVTKVDQLQVGNWVQGVNTGAPPTALFSLVSTDRIWVEANFKETELTHMKPGQKATIEIDTYPDVEFEATVNSLSPGTGLTFSLLPPENATGNWVKVVQRLPVRLSIKNPDPSRPLHAGLSATVEVDTRHARPWLTWLKKTFSGSAQAGEAEH